MCKGPGVGSCHVFELHRGAECSQSRVGGRGAVGLRAEIMEGPWVLLSKDSRFFFWVKWEPWQGSEQRRDRI